MKKISIILALFLLFFSEHIAAQGLAFNTGTPIDRPAMLDVKSSNKAILIPRMTQARRIVITSPVSGRMIYQTDATGPFYYWDNIVNKWVTMSTSDFNYVLQQNLNTNGKYISADGGAGGILLNRGSYSAAIGNVANASGQYSTAIGNGVTASGDYSIAMGTSTNASGKYSISMGAGTSANGLNSTAMGYKTTADGNYSTAMGNYVSTQGADGAFIIGDYPSSVDPNNYVTRANPQQMVMRFANGYQLWTSDNLSTGVGIAPGGNSWNILSDVNRKENFEFINEEKFLNKITSVPLSTWNYKGQDPKQFRHYGPMAQDFFKAFGKDDYGTIGNDTTINQADFEGITFTGVHALERRTTEMNEQLKEQMRTIEQQKEILQKQHAQLLSLSKEVEFLKLKIK